METNWYLFVQPGGRTRVYVVREWVGFTVTNYALRDVIAAHRAGFMRLDEARLHPGDD